MTKSDEPTTEAMMAAVELEIAFCIGRVTTRAIGKTVQKAIDASRSPAETAGPIAWVNGDELANLLDDRCTLVQGTQSGWCKTPLYAHPAPPAAANVREALERIKGAIADLQGEHEVMCGRPIDPASWNIDIPVSDLQTILAALSEPAPAAPTLEEIASSESQTAPIESKDDWTSDPFTRAAQSQAECAAPVSETDIRCVIDNVTIGFIPFNVAMDIAKAILANYEVTPLTRPERGGIENS